MRVLLSINPMHVDNIVLGVKKFEFRRKIFARRDVSAALIYCTRPVGKIVGEFQIDGILQGHPNEIWAETWRYSGISRAFFDQYFQGRPVGFALKIGALDIFDEPQCPGKWFDNFSPPQSYMYVPNAVRERSPKQLSLFQEDL